MTHDEIEQVARMAARMHGQEWEKLSHYSKDYWRETVRHPLSAPPQNDIERCVVEAKELWQQRQAEPEEAKPVERKSKNKK